MRFLTETMKSAGKILVVMYGLTALLLFLLAVFVQRFGLEQNGISIGISIVYVAVCFVGGFFSGKVQKTKKFIWGILMGLMYVVIMLMITLAVKQGFEAAASDFVLNLVLCLGSGMLGGMIS